MPEEIIAIDVGNSRYHIARYRWRNGTSVGPEPVPWDDSQQIVWSMETLDRLSALRFPEPMRRWFLVSVHRGREADLLEWIGRHRPGDRIYRLIWSDFGLPLDVEYPERLGLDRIAAACAACQLRPQGRSALVVDVGTAITIDLVDEDGIFRGGAIFPGLRAAAEALYASTDALPLVRSVPEHPPPIVGRYTEAAIASGLYYGMRSALAGIVDQMASTRPKPPELFVTGYANAVDWLRHWHPRWVPDLVLRGVALTARRLLEKLESSPES